MREIMKFFGQKYSVVNQQENGQTFLEQNNGNVQQNQQQQQQNGDCKKSLNPNRSINKGFSILDVFFNKRKAGQGPRWPKGIFLLKASGLLAIISAIVMYILQPYEAIFKWKLLFAQDGEIFNLWQKPPVDLYVKIYLYNITNPEEFMSGLEKMRVEEVGPYVYRENLVHDDIIFNKNGTLSSVPKHPLVWQDEMSMGHKEDDIFMLPNIALLSIAQVASEKSYFLRLPINLVIRQTNSQPIVKMTAKEFMFGYESPLTTLGNQFLPDWIYFDKVGLIDRMYDFEGDYETVFTGETDSSISGLIDTYRGSEHLKQWEKPHCSNIHMASDGTKFKSFIDTNETLLFFRKNMCRATTLVRVGDEQTVGPLNAYKYQFEKNAMDNGFTDERNKCFCRNDRCLPHGLLDVSECYYGFPIALSYPHFLDSDEKLLNDVDGSKPIRSSHETYFKIQPMSGLPLELSVKMQINMAMRDVSNMAHVEQFSNIVVPMLWFEITMPKLPDSLQTRFNLYLNILPVVDSLGQIFLFATGIILFLIAIVRASMRFSRTIQPSHKISNQRKYSSIIGRITDDDHCDGSNNGGIGGLGGDDNRSYEMSEKCIHRNGDSLFDINLVDEENLYMLEQEPAISENDYDCETKTLSYVEDDRRSCRRVGDDSICSGSTDAVGGGSGGGDGDGGIGDRSSSSTAIIGSGNSGLGYDHSSSSNLLSENHGFEMDPATESLIDNCHLGVTSSSIDDIGNDNFHVLRIEEDDDDIRATANQLRKASIDSISSILDRVDIV